MARQNNPACHKCGSKRERNLVVFYTPESGLKYTCLYCLLGGSRANSRDRYRVKSVSDWLVVGAEYFDNNHIPVMQSEQIKGIIKSWCNA